MMRTMGAAAALALLALTAGCGGSSDNGEPPALAIEVLEESDSGGVFYAFDTPPVLEHYQAPDYPEDARRDGRQGTVVVRVLVDARGMVAEVEVLKSDDRVFDAAALEAVREFRFRAAELDGSPVPSRVAVPIQFALQ